MTFIDAALAVLASSSRPLSTAEITKRALAKGLIQSSGKTPEATMSAHLYRHVKNDPKPRVVRVSEPVVIRARSGTVRWTLPNHQRSSN